MRFKRVSLCFLLLVALFVAFFGLPSVVWAQQGDAASAISAAQGKLVQCFDAARAAESAGANISSLTSVLNDAGTQLSEAELAYSSGDFGLASNLASQAQSSLSSFISDADALRSAGVAASNQHTLIFVGSIAGTFVVIGSAGAVWVLLKRKYGNDSGVQKSESDTV